jgi:F-type H+-transporting ATPase subunit alpha
LMKQAQYSPLSVAEMALSLFAANEGYLDDVEVNKVVSFEAALLSHLRSSYAGDIDAINSNPVYSDEVEAKLRSIVDDFVASGAY